MHPGPTPARSNSTAETRRDRAADQGGTPAWNAILSATRDAAKSIGSSDISLIQPGRNADIVAVKAIRFADVTALEHVVFVMKGDNVLRISN